MLRSPPIWFVITMGAGGCLAQYYDRNHHDPKPMLGSWVSTDGSDVLGCDSTGNQTQDLGNGLFRFILANGNDSDLEMQLDNCHWKLDVVGTHAYLQNRQHCDEKIDDNSMFSEDAAKGELWISSDGN